MKDDETKSEQINVKINALTSDKNITFNVFELRSLYVKLSEATDEIERNKINTEIERLLSGED